MFKKFIFLLLSLLLFAAPSFATESEKGRDEMRKELQEFKLKYLAQEMNLAPSKQQEFYQTYSAMQEEKRKVFKEAHAYKKALKKNENASDADYAKASKMMADAKIREGEIDKKYDAIFAKFLTSKQIYKMKEAEQKFRQKMREMKKKKK
ncbi:MAG: hypothetical protein HDS70_04145 [Bacteroidales bacterium]|nr:hypothetical protein [Bacteroidales bacterium]